MLSSVWYAYNLGEAPPKEGKKDGKWLKELDELEIVKNYLAQYNPFVISLELSQDQDTPEIPDGNKYVQYQVRLNVTTTT